MFKTYEINVDLISDTAVPSSAIRFSTNDRNAAKLLLTITNKGAEVDLSQAKSVRISFKKPDGTRVFQNDCQPINALKGKYQIVLKTQTLAAEGYVYAQIHIEEADRVLDTQTFFFVVNESLASDQAIESINELSIIQKALELGEKFKNVDFDPIIKAGELAANALPMSGGTMTGTTTFEAGDLRFKNAANDVLFRNNTSGIFSFFDIAQNQVVWNYNPATKEFIVNTATNLVKKGGDIMTGNLKLDRATGQYRWVQWTTANNIAFSLGMTSSEVFMLQDTVGNQIIFSYNPATKELIFTSGQKVTVNAETNLLKKTGDTMTNHLGFQLSNGGKQIRGENGTDLRSGFLLEDTGFRGYDWQNGREVFKYTASTNTFDVIAPNTNLVTKTKDGRAELTLTADATNWDTNYTPRVERRGNTATVMLAITRNAGASSEVVTTLPVDMRPTTPLIKHVIAQDGTPVRINIGTGGAIQVGTTGKNLYIMETYVVN